MVQACSCDSEGCNAALSSVEFPSGLALRAQLFKALGDEIRLKVLHLLRDHEVCVCDLMAVLKMPQGTLSHHLAVLQQAGLVVFRKQGRWNYYQATPCALGPLTAFEGAQI